MYDREMLRDVRSLISALVAMMAEALFGSSSAGMVSP
jgi:hypothetical protein